MKQNKPQMWVCAMPESCTFDWCPAPTPTPEPSCSYPEVSADEGVDAGDDEEREDELEHRGEYRVPE